MNVYRITSWDELATLREAWNALADDIPFLQWDWLGIWWKHYGMGVPRRELFVLAVYDDVEAVASGSQNEAKIDNNGRSAPTNPNRKLVGIAPWMIQKSATAGTSIEFLGEEEACTDHVTVLCAPTYHQQVGATIADYLAHQFRNWDVLDLYGVDDADPAIGHLMASLENLGLGTSDSQHAYNCWKLELPTDWDAYYHTLSKSHRRQMRRAFRRIEEAGSLQIRITKTSEELETDWETLVRLHQERWASRGEPGCVASSRFDAFQREVVPLLLVSGHLRLSVTELDGDAIAAEYNLASCTTTYAYQSGIDPGQIELEPGRLSMAAAIRSAIEGGCTWHDYLRGDEPYKPHWRAVPVPTWHHRVVNCRSVARLRDAGWRVAVGAKEMVKAGLGRKKET